MAHLDRDDVLARVDLAEILTREVGPPHKRGVEWWWPSVEPGMEGTGRTPPTHIIPPTAASNGVAMFKDFASGTSGTAIDVLMIRRGFDFTTALQALANDAGLTSRVPPPPLPPSRQQARPRPQPPSAELITWVRDCSITSCTVLPPKLPSELVFSTSSQREVQQREGATSFSTLNPVSPQNLTRYTL
jgi:hypothetical protein